MKITPKIQHFLADIRGVGAVEFALIVPFMLAVWMGSVELATLELVSRKVSVATQTMADLVAQENRITVAQLDTIISVGRQILAPFPDNMNIRIISVEADLDGSVGIGWEFPVGGGAGIPPRARPLVIQNESVISVIVSYKSEGPLGQFSRDIIEEAYARPRRVRIIPFDPE